LNPAQKEKGGRVEILTSIAGASLGKKRGIAAIVLKVLGGSTSATEKKGKKENSSEIRLLDAQVSSLRGGRGFIKKG